MGLRQRIPLGYLSTRDHEICGHSNSFSGILYMLLESMSIDYIIGGSIT